MKTHRTVQAMPASPAQNINSASKNNSLSGSSTDYLLRSKSEFPTSQGVLAHTESGRPLTTESCSDREITTNCQLAQQFSAMEISDVKRKEIHAPSNIMRSETPDLRRQKVEESSKENNSATSRRCHSLDEDYTVDTDGDTALNIAIISRFEEVAMSLIDNCPSPDSINLNNFLYQTPLLLAVLTNQRSIARRLVVAGADVTARDKNGNTPLHVASKNGNLAIVKTLLTPILFSESLQNSYETPHQKIPQHLEIRNYDGLTCFHLAAQGSHTEVLATLAEAGCDVNAGDLKSGRTALHEASRSNNVDLVRFLLKLPQCDANAHAYNDVTPFDLARSHGHWDVTMLLASHGARQNADTSDDDTRL